MLISRGGYRMKPNKMILKMIQKPLTTMGLQAYQQGKKDTENKEYDEETFKKEFMKTIKDQF